MWDTRITRLLGIRYPLLEGGLYQCGNAELAAAVSNAGALGVVGANPGLLPPEQIAGNLRRHIRRTRELTDKPFGVNVPMFVLGRLAPGLIEAVIDVVLEEDVHIIITSGDDPRKFTKKLKDAGRTVLHVVGSARQARVAEGAGVDAIVTEGYEGGGVKALTELTTMTMVPYVVDAVQVPVVAAGGIADSRATVAAFALGAEGVQVGSLFLAARECMAHDNFKAAIVAAGETDTTMVGRAMGWRARLLRNAFAKRMEELDLKGDGDEERKMMELSRMRNGIIDGDAVDALLPVGQVAGRIRAVGGAAEMVEAIMGGTGDVVQRVNHLYRG